MFRFYVFYTILLMDEGCDVMIFESNSVEDTEDVGRCLGSIAQKGYIVCLTGDLGVGKTEFVKGFAAGAGVSGYVTSPTFTIINEYIGRLPVYHFDVYRINRIDEMFEIGYEEFFFGDGITIIEWADMIEEILPKERISVTLEKDMDEGEDFRRIAIETNGEMYDGVLREMIEKCEF
mgnify:CR=1 FL=1